ncbi:MAG: homocysteine S-methyltransferase family protein [Chloroflexi bacterium]|nr:homocysteine S-methyltransferase family protein [Chloroflexota bacterium]
MSELLEHLKSGAVLADGGIGSLLFERTGRLSETNHVYEALNVDRPELIRGVHLAYLQAGARCITTNTFGANSTHLDPVGEGHRVVELNSAGVKVAREAIVAFREQTGVEGPFFLLGSVGPTRTGQESPGRLKGIYQRQLETLVGEGVDAVLFETFGVLDHLTALIKLAKQAGPRTPVVAEMALRMKPDGSGWQQDPVAFVNAAAEHGADVVGVNCCAPWEATAFHEVVKDVPVVRERRVLVSAMPNAGGFQRIGHRYMTHVNPEYMGKLARTFANLGVNLVGGCCEVHPNHIAEMYNYLHGLAGGKTVAPALSTHARTPAGDDIKKTNGKFSAKIKSGIKSDQFAVSVETLPPRGTGAGLLKSKVEFVRELAESGLADAVDITDGSRGIPLMPPGDFASVVRESLGWTAATGDALEFIPHFSTRDLNVMGLQSRLIGYHARRIYNVLFITGDPPKMAPTYPRSTAVFDLDSIGMVRYAHGYLNAGVDFGGEPLGRQGDPRTRFTVGCGFEPEAVNREREVERLRRKIDAGADYVFTQPVFRRSALEVLEPFRGGVPILIGVMILSGLEHANRMAEVPGVVIPEDLIKRMAKFETVEDQARLGQDLAAEQIRWVRDQGWPGVYLMSPASHRPVLPVLRAALGG